MDSLDMKIMRHLWKAENAVPVATLRQSVCGEHRDIAAALSSLLRGGYIHRIRRKGQVHYRALCSFSEMGMLVMEEHIKLFYDGNLDAFLADYKSKGISSRDNQENMNPEGRCTRP